MIADSEVMLSVKDIKQHHDDLINQYVEINNFERNILGRSAFICAVNIPIRQCRLFKIVLMPFHYDIIKM